MQPPPPCRRFVQQHLGGLHPGRQRRLCGRLPRHHRRAADGELAAQHGAAADRGAPRGCATGCHGDGKMLGKPMENPWKMRIEAGNMGGFAQKWDDLMISATRFWI